MTEEFNLSDKRSQIDEDQHTEFYIYHEEDIKEFIRLLKDEIKSTDDSIGWDSHLLVVIDKLAGDKLK